MSQEKVKVVVEVKGGYVNAVYAGDFVEVVIINHDAAEVNEIPVEPLSVVHPVDYKAFDGGFPDSWNVTNNTKTL